MSRQGLRTSTPGWQSTAIPPCWAALLSVLIAVWKVIHWRDNHLDLSICISAEWKLAIWTTLSGLILSAIVILIQYFDIEYGILEGLVVMWKETIPPTPEPELWVSQDNGWNSAPPHLHNDCALWLRGWRGGRLHKGENNGESGYQVTKVWIKSQEHWTDHIFRKTCFRCVVYQIHKFYLEDFKT